MLKAIEIASETLYSFCDMLYPSIKHHAAAVSLATLSIGLAAGAVQTSPSWRQYGKYPPPVAPYSNDDLPRESANIDIIFPLIGKTTFRDDYNAQRSGFKHTGIDMRAAKMTPIIAPFSGIFGFKEHSFWIYAKNGWRCLGTHLNDDTPGTQDGKNDFDFMFAADLKFGDYVTAGQFIGYVGDSGDATAPHLHFELYAPEGIRNPYNALMKATRLEKPKPSISYGFAPPEPGVERFDVCKRSWNQATNTFTGQLVSKQYSTGDTLVVTQPKKVEFTFPGSVVPQSAIDAWPTDRPCAIYFRRDQSALTVLKVVRPSAQ